MKVQTTEPPRLIAPKFPCPRCGHWVSKVKDARATGGGEFQRKRICQLCKGWFFTVEKVA